MIAMLEKTQNTPYNFGLSVCIVLVYYEKFKMAALCAHLYDRDVCDNVSNIGCFMGYVIVYQ